MAVLILPFPAWAIDLLIVAAIVVSLLMLLRGLIVSTFRKASGYPNHIVLFMLFNLAVLVATTRRILLYGGEQGVDAAGRMVKLFGPFLFVGNYVMGLTAILLLLAVYFLVVNHGAGRIAEAMARFTLDAMPSKQMAIEADPNAGRMDEQRAENRRKKLQGEGEFYEAVDGAVKFIQRDAIALFLILLVNMVAGTAIGMFKYDLAILDAMEKFILLVIGSGLAVTAPAIVVTIGAIALIKQLANPTYRRTLEMEELMLEYEEYVNKAKAGKATNEGMADESCQDPLLEIGLGLVPQMGMAQKGGSVLERISAMRQRIADESGVSVPPIRMRDNPKLPANSYRLLISEKELGRGEVVPGQYLAMNPGTATEPLEGEATKEPVFGLPSFWIEEDMKDKARLLGYTVVDSPTVMTTHISEMLKALAEAASVTKDPIMLAEFVRQHLGATIIGQHLSEINEQELMILAKGEPR